MSRNFRNFPLSSFLYTCENYIESQDTWNKYEHTQDLLYKDYFKLIRNKCDVKHHLQVPFDVLEFDEKEMFDKTLEILKTVDNYATNKWTVVLDDVSESLIIFVKTKEEQFKIAMAIL